MSTQRVDARHPAKRTERKKTRKRKEFLAGANDLLAQTTRLIGAGLDEDTTLARIAQLSLPRAGVWSMLAIPAAADAQARREHDKGFNSRRRQKSPPGRLP